MMSKPSPKGDDDSNDASAAGINESSFFQSACLEILEDGKLVLSYARAGNEKEPLHTGKWTDEEMAYAEGLVDEFKEGNLALPDGTSLRQFLAKMLNCSPKRISKRYEGNNYSKGRKFYVKSTTRLNPFEAQRRRARLQDLERQHKQKLLELKIPHLLIAGRPQDDPQGEDGTTSVGGNKKLPATQNARGHQNTRGLVGGALPAPVASIRMVTGAPGGGGLPASLSSVVPTLGMDQSMFSNRASLREAAAATMPSALDPGRSLTSGLSSSAMDEYLMSDFTNAPGYNADLLAQLRVNQAESQRLSRLLELQRGLTAGTSISNLGQQQMRQSLLQRELQPSALLGNQLSSLFGPSQAHERNVGFSPHQLQELLRAQETRTSIHQDVTRIPNYATSFLDRPQASSSSRTTFAPSLAAQAGITSQQLNQSIDPQFNSLIQMQLQAQQAASLTRRNIDPLILGMSQRQEFKVSDEDEESHNQRLNSMLSRFASSAAPQPQPAVPVIGLDPGTTATTQTRLLLAAQQPVDNNLLPVHRFLQLPPSPTSAAAAAAAQGGRSAARGQKRTNDDTSDADGGPNSRRRRR